MTGVLRCLIFDAASPWAEATRAALSEKGHEVHRREVEILADMRATRSEVKALMPHAVVMLEGLDDPETAGGSPDAVFRINTEGPISLAAAAMEFKSRAILCMPFRALEGQGGQLGEFDAPEPRSLWSESRERGATFLQRANPQSLILRTGPILELSAIRRRLKNAIAVHPKTEIFPLTPAQLADGLIRSAERALSGRIHLLPSDPPIELRAFWSEIAAQLQLPEPRFTEGERYPRLISERQADWGPEDLGSWRDSLWGPQRASTGEPVAPGETEAEPRPGTDASVDADAQPDASVNAQPDASVDADAQPDACARSSLAPGMERLLARAGEVRHYRHEAGFTVSEGPKARFLVLLQGKIWMELRGEDRILQAGSVISLPEGPHELGLRGKAAWLEIDLP